MLPDHLSLGECRHGLMLYLKNDVYIGRSLELYGEYSPGEYELFSQLVRPGMTVLEVGANLGALTVPLCRLAGPDGLVLAFEPQVTLSHILTANLALNGLSNGRVHQVGVGQQPGSMYLPRINYADRNNYGSLSLGGEGQDEVEIRTIDSYRLGRCDLIKIDVEGMEADVLSGAVETINRLKPVIFVENDRRDKSTALIRLLQSLDYRMWWHFTPLFADNNWRGHAENVFKNEISINLLCFPSHVAVETPFREVKSDAEDWYTIVNGPA